MLSLMEKKLAMQKKGLLSDQEIRRIVDKWKDKREEDNLDPGVVEREVKILEKKFKQHNVPWIGHITEERDDRNFRIR